MILDNTTTTFEMQAASNPSAAVPFLVTFYEQVGAQMISPKTSGMKWPNPQKSMGQLASGGTATVTALAAPGAGKRRIISTVSMRNASSGTVIYKARVLDSTESPTSAELRFSLATGDMLFYNGGPNGGTWRVLDSFGRER